MKKLPLIALLTLTALGSGCSWFHSNTRDQQWHAAVQERPLEVPPDLEKPVNAAALTIPTLPNASASSAPETAPPGTLAAVGAVQGSASLLLNDTVDSVYNRVGVALKKGGIGNVQNADAASHAYRVEVNTTVTEKPKGFFSRIFSSAKSHVVSNIVTINVVADGNKARVELQGPKTAVLQLQAALQQRLG
jgi:uncharacterized lipoprotein